LRREVANDPFVLIVGSSAPIRSVPELLQSAKANGLSFGSYWVGSPAHILSLNLLQASGTPARQVPVKSPTYIALKDQLVDFMFSAVSSETENIRAGRVKALAVSSSKRSPFHPDLPTLSEAGYQGHDVTGWVGVWAPATTQRNILEQLSHQLTRIAAMPDVQAKLAEAFMEPSPLGIDDFTTFVKGEYERWGKIARAGKVMND
jgi:tripartite-type tricarboxylate transporter receptor subunit TctC